MQLKILCGPQYSGIPFSRATFRRLLPGSTSMDFFSLTKVILAMMRWGSRFVEIVNGAG